jgi:integrase
MATKSSKTSVTSLYQRVVKAKRPPTFEQYQNRGSTLFRVYLGTDVQGKPVRKGLGAKEDEAKARYAEICNRVESGDSIEAFEAAETYADFEFKAARKKLRPYSATVLQAAEFFIKYHRPAKGLITVEEALERWKEDAEQKNLSDTFIEKMLDTYAGPFARHFEGRRLMDITYEDAKNYVFKKKERLSSYSKVQLIQKLRAFFNRVAKIGYYSKDLNPFKDVEPPKRKLGIDKDIDRVISVNVMRETLEFALASEKKGFREVGVAIVLISYCGIRQQELWRMSWEQVDDSDDEKWSVRVPPLESKLGYQRDIDIPNNAIAWLEAFLDSG